MLPGEGRVDGIRLHRAACPPSRLLSPRATLHLRRSHPLLSRLHFAGGAGMEGAGGSLADSEPSDGEQKHTEEGGCRPSNRSSNRSPLAIGWWMHGFNPVRGTGSILSVDS